MNNARSRRRGPADQQAREALRPLVETGTAICPRCNKPIEPGQPWDAGHVLALGEGGHPDGQRRPEHAACNRSAGARLGAQLRARPRRRAAEWARS